MNIEKQNKDTIIIIDYKTLIIFHK